MLHAICIYPSITTYSARETLAFCKIVTCTQIDFLDVRTDVHVLVLCDFDAGERNNKESISNVD